MIIDFHTHVFSPEVVDNRSKYVLDDKLFGALYSNQKSRLVTTDELINNMDSINIQKSVILNIAWNSHSLCVKTNDYIMESVARYPDRLIGFCTVVFGKPDLAIKELERCCNGGIKGVGEIRPAGLFLESDSLSKPIINFLIENDLILLTHTSEPVGHSYPGKGEITPEILYPFITRNPDLKLVCAHWGGGLPFYSLMPDVKPYFHNLFFDSAASPYLYYSEVYSHVIQLVGPDKILFGSDYPLLHPKRLLNEIDSLNISPLVKNKITAENAIRLLKI
jgi:predicted TIM-barrel fold metal-dependent hydrolase